MTAGEKKKKRNKKDKGGLDDPTAWPSLGESQDGEEGAANRRSGENTPKSGPGTPQQGKKGKNKKNWVPLKLEERYDNGGLRPSSADFPRAAWFDVGKS
jgi:hypothetical protein